jgi:hypothetical protein
VKNLLILRTCTDRILEGGKYGTALQAASETGHLDIIKMLLAAGADPNIEGVVFRPWFNLTRKLKAANTEWLSKQCRMLDARRLYDCLLRTEQK